MRIPQLAFLVLFALSLIGGLPAEAADETPATPADGTRVFDLGSGMRLALILPEGWQVAERPAEGVLTITLAPARGDAFTAVLAAQVFDEKNGLLSTPEEMKAFLSYIFSRKRPDEPPPQIERLDPAGGIGVYGTAPAAAGSSSTFTLGYFAIGRIHVQTVFVPKGSDDALLRQFLEIARSAAAL